MMNPEHAEYDMRDSILKLLSDDEVARVSTAETAVRLSVGDEYVDLEQLDRGVQCASDAAEAMGRVLPKKAVQETTWSSIVTLLGTPGSATAHT